MTRGSRIMFSNAALGKLDALDGEIRSSPFG
jgi:hypothetical protein